MTIYTVRAEHSLCPLAVRDSFTAALAALEVEVVIRQSQPAPTVDGLFRFHITTDDADGPGLPERLVYTLVDADGASPVRRCCDDHPC